MTGLAALGQTIQVVDRSGKVVSTSRHILDVLRIGKDAYSRQKRETNAKREHESLQARSLKRRGRAYTLDESGSVRSGRSHRSHRSHRHHPEPYESTRSPDVPQFPGQPPAGAPFHEAHPEYVPPSPRRHSEFTHRPGPPAHSHSTPVPPHYPSAVPPQPQWSPEPVHDQSLSASRGAHDFRPVAMTRRSTTKPGRVPSKRRSLDGVDMNLAYGDMPPDLLYPGSPSVAASPEQNEAQLTGLIGKANTLLDEANCLKSGATATIAHLQKNPDAMAAVGLTLAEISNLVKKMSPAVLLNLKRASPAVFSLLAHPQFLVAVGVATGVTIIAFGGYKIVKRIQERKQMESMGDEALLPVEDVSRIETWRRGIADAEARSVGTSVEGEFITPLAHNLSRMNLAEERREYELEKREKERGRDRKPKSRPPKSITSGRSNKTTKTKRSSSEPRAPKTKMGGGPNGKSTSGKSKRTTVKKQEMKPSPLRRLLLT